MKNNNEPKKLKKLSTSIMEDARLALDITRDDYALCQYIHYRSADPRQTKRGWCCDTKEDLAFFVGISRAGIYKMIDRLERLRLIETDPTTGFICTCVRWIDTESQHREKVQGKKKSVNKVDTLEKDGVNKVDIECKQSLQESVNKVTPNIKVEYDNKIDKEEESSALPLSSSSSPEPGSFPVEEKPLYAETLTPAAPAAPRFPHQVYATSSTAPIEAFDLGAGVESIRGNFQMKEAFSMSYRVPAQLFDEYLKDFHTQEAGVGTIHHNQRELNRHFLNYAAKRHQSEQARKAAAPATNYAPPSRPTKTSAFVE